MTIPKIIHYCWFGGDIPPQMQQWMNTWDVYLAGFERMEWNDSNIVLDTPFLKSAYQQKRWNRLSNYIRMRAVLEFGGVYLDTDFEFIRPIDDLMQFDCFVAFQTKAWNRYGSVNNAILASCPGHNLWEENLQEMRKTHETSGTLEPGPKILTNVLEKRGLREVREQDLGDIHLFPREYFYPYFWGEPFHPEIHITPATRAIHHWYGYRPGLLGKIRKIYYILKHKLQKKPA